jgi:hypothetical protein
VVFGPELLARYLQVVGEPDKWGNRWQYNSRSDRHSKVGSWGIALDLLATSTALRAHVAAGKVVLGVNHTMTDFATGRKKDLDLVIARPAGPVPTDAATFASLTDRYHIVLVDDERAALEDIAPFPIAPVGATLIALEAKACMTAHVKSLPRLYDELNSSHLCVHGASRHALAIGYVQVNASTEFVSSVTNNFPLDQTPARVTKHRQPQDTLRVLAKVAEIPRRSASSEVGFDGVGVSVLNFHNDGGSVLVEHAPPAPQPGDTLHYDSMIVRMANEYDATFPGI